MYSISLRPLIRGNPVKRLESAHGFILYLAFIFCMYWNIGDILPYQRHFNFINGPREIGKTYTTLKWLIKQALVKGKTFVYLCRTQDEKKNGILEHATAKVIAECYADYKVKSTPFTLHLNDILVAQCVALSEYMKIKKFSFPSCHYIIFDEYMLEATDSRAYVQGWKEPDLFLSIYQTIDRARDQTICFCLGNNTAFYNPYHLHQAFDIPFTHQGEIWTSKNVLFQWAVPSKTLQEKLKHNAINQQIKDTEYGKSAIQGQYTGENDMFLAQLDGSCRYQFTMKYTQFEFGVYTSEQKGICIVSDKIDPSCNWAYALTLDDHTENTLLLTRDNVHLKWFSTLYKHGLVRFSSMKVKQRAADLIRMVVK